MLKKLILENWKSFRYAELPLDPLTVLIGTNASGKSNVVEALEFLQRIANGENIEAALAGNKTLPSLRGGVELAARKGENEFSLNVLIQGEDDTVEYMYLIKVKTISEPKIIEEYIYEYTILINEYGDGKKLISVSSAANQDNYSVDTSFLNIVDTSIEIIRKNIITLENDQEKKLMEEVYNTFLLPKQKKRICINSSLKRIFLLNPVASNMRDYSSLSNVLESDSSNIAGFLAALPDDKKTEIENTLSEYLKDLPEGDIKKVWAEKVGRLGTDAMLYCQEEWKPGEIIEIDARSMSDGTLRFLAILTALLTRPEGSQIVIEEIDNGLHPSRAALLVKILKEIGSKRNIDILLTTHNPALLDAFGSEIVPFVVVAHRDSETGESKLTLLEDIDNFPKLFASYSLGQMTTKGAIERSLSHGE
ncbi:AAA family ATPase [Dolichospermum sp. FACHB-1091]|uniref:AAA family ATPase n=1 Tax=Dolichospermum sp. FACHB-1091 TaxID=2692798 RepID=UPI001681451A|nr:ATP-binding protein [Dolichospermum sp. FACHB-1091]MBD2441720.1 AAA family ATPase [Dolichospermum sp. FACHB-1091]